MSDENIILDGLKKVTKNIDLSIQEAENCMRQIMSGNVTNAQLGAFLTALSMKGESIEEITGFAKIMREFANRIEPKVSGELLDTCGTGGDKINRCNISTISALVVAGAGVHVAPESRPPVAGRIQAGGVAPLPSSPQTCRAGRIC